VTDRPPVVIRGDAAHLPLPDDSVDLIVTSPPYFALRSYQDAGEHYAGQIGSEPTPAAFLDALWTCTREWVRVLKPSGSLTTCRMTIAGSLNGAPPTRNCVLASAGNVSPCGS
jgi:ubiquinone/menaquinone biosynthesis C-methylase UbiE